MQVKEALIFFDKVHYLFKKHEDFSCVSEVYDAYNLVDKANNKATEKSIAIQLEFMYNTTMYSLLYNSRTQVLKLLDYSQGYEYPIITKVQNLKDIIDTLEKEDS